MLFRITTIIFLFFSFSFASPPDVGECVLVDGEKYRIDSVNFYYDSETYSNCNHDELGVIWYQDYMGDGKYDLRYLGDCQTLDDGNVENIEYGSWYAYKEDCDICEEVTPPQTLNDLTYTGKSFAELADCDKYMEDSGLSNASCVSAESVKGDIENPCPQYFLYAGCQTYPDSPPNYPDYKLFGPYQTGDECISAQNTYQWEKPPSSCIQTEEYCPWYFYGFPKVDTCEHAIPPLSNYGGFPFAGRFPNSAECQAALAKTPTGMGVCLPADDCPPNYDGYFDVDGDPNTDNNLSDTDGDGIPDGDVESTTNTKDLNDSGSPKIVDDNNDSVDMGPVLDQLKEFSDRSHNDMDQINANLNKNFDRQAGQLSQISGDIRNTNSKLQDLIDLQNDQNSKIDEMMESNTTGFKPIADNTKGILDESKAMNEKLSNIENNISGIGGLFSSISDIINDTDSVSDTLQNGIGEITDRYIGQQIISVPDCGTVPTVSVSVFGRNVVFLSEDVINAWPLDIIRAMVVFMFGLTGVMTLFRGS